MQQWEESAAAVEEPALEGLANSSQPGRKLIPNE